MVWTIKDKNRLLCALRKYGSNNIEALTKELEFKSSTEIRYMISKYKRAAEKSVKNIKKKRCVKEPISNWLNLMQEVSTLQYQGFLARVLKYVALFEEHTEGDTINLKDCYQLLANAVSGETSKEVNTTTAAFHLNCLSDLSAESSATKIQKERAFLDNFCPKEGDAIKSYARKNSVASLVSDVELNPLKVPANLLTISWAVD